MLKKVFVLGAMTYVLLLGSSQPVSAGCFTDLDDCMHAAALEDHFWRRWEKGLDCELDFIDCVGEKLNPFLD